jgi:hypothetical protein
MCCSASITTLVLRGSSEAGDRHALLLATRQGLGPLAGHAGHVEAFQRRQGQCLLLVGPHLQQGARGRHMEGTAHQHVGQHVEAAGKVELLEDHGAARPPGAQRPAAQGRDVGVAEQNAAGGGFAQAVDHAQQGRLAGAGPADHADHLADGNSQSCVVDGMLAAEALGHPFKSQHRNSQPVRGVAPAAG